MKIIQAGRGTLYLGRQGEHLALRVRFPVGEWRALYGNGRFRLVAQRAGDAAPYIAAVTEDPEFVCWDLTRADTAAAGTGRCELHYCVGGALVKSRIWTTCVSAALDGDAADGAYADAGAAGGGEGGPVPETLPVYDGSWEVTPLVGAEVELKTARKYLDRDIVVRPVPYAETSNAGGGYTAIIGG